jgi:hypothetical protein
MFSILNRAYLPNINTIKERSIIKGDQKMDLFQSKFKDLKIISNLVFPATSGIGSLTQSSSLSKLLDGTYPSGAVKLLLNNGIMHSSDANKENIHNTIYNSIGYKNMAGIRLEVKGRLTKRYRADRSIYSLK